MITITNFPRGVRGVRVAWVCEEMSLPYRVEPVGFPPPAAYLAKNPLGSVPFLEDGEVAINESIAMCLYLAGRYGPTPLLPVSSDPAYARVIQMTVFAEATLGAGLNTLMMAHFAAPDPDKGNWSVRAQEERVSTAIAFIGKKLDGNDYLAGNGLTLADIAISTSLGMWSGALGKPVPEDLAKWRARLSERPAYQRASAAAGAGPRPES
jgi:glutathione S-transferase